MGQEIERKFLVKSEVYKTLTLGLRYMQGYLNSQEERIVRVRSAGEKGYLTVKGITSGVSRLEFEYEIPVNDAIEMLNKLCEKPIIDKNRYRVKIGDLYWEIDEFHGENEGLVVAEVELKYEDQKFDKPEWIGEEVTGDPKYFNSNLFRNPYRNWK